MSETAERERRANLFAYDLGPPAPSPPGEFQAIRHPHRVPPRRRYTPPPLPDDYVRVWLGFGDEATWYEWDRPDSDEPWRVHDIPAEQQDRWAKAMADYQAMQDEIDALMETRHRERGWPNVPPGWAPKPAG